MPTAAAIIAGGTVVSAIAGNKASKRQAKATQSGIDATNALLGPYSEAGAAGIPAVQDFVDEGARFSDTQAFKDITNSSKAGGAFGSGNRATALTDYYATNFRPQRLNELLSLPTIGANASAQQATNLGNQYNALGDARAAGPLAIGNAVNSGINSLAFLNAYKGNGTVQSGVNKLFEQPGIF